MSKLNPLIVKKLLIGAILIAFALMLNAQKLPNIQKESVFTHQQITIDGKFREWGSSLKAHNSATEISYTLANDDSYLYLVVQTTDNDAVNKICRGGVTLAIQKSGKMDDKDVPTITYPQSDLKGNFNIRPPRPGQKVDTSIEAIAALIDKFNKVLQQHIKSIRVNGVEGVDTLISIYNDNDIKAACTFDLKKAFTLELSVPLKYFKLSAVDQQKFAYHIILNGYKTRPNIVNNMDGTPAASANALNLQAAMDRMDAAMSARVDFWGEYTLAKK